MLIYPNVMTSNLNKIEYILFLDFKYNIYSIFLLLIELSFSILSCI